MLNQPDELLVSHALDWWPAILGYDTDHINYYASCRGHTLLPSLGHCSLLLPIFLTLLSMHPSLLVVGPYSDWRVDHPRLAKLRPVGNRYQPVSISWETGNWYQPDNQ